MIIILRKKTHIQIIEFTINPVRQFMIVFGGNRNGNIILNSFFPIC